MPPRSAAAPTQNMKLERLFEARIGRIDPTPGCTILRHAVLSGLFACILTGLCMAQPAPSKPKEIFRDADGKLISNNEFVDLRLANSTDKTDPATRTVLDDGTIEFRVASPRQEGTDAPSF